MQRWVDIPSFPPLRPSSSHAALIASMKLIAGPNNVLTSVAEKDLYECEGFLID
jgi:hypothetical protein